MKILKYTLFPLKIIITLVVIAAFVYYRSVIFHSNVTEPVDYVLSIVEDKFEITIPAYTAQPRLGRFVDKPVSVTAAVENRPDITIIDDTNLGELQEPESSSSTASDIISSTEVIASVDENNEKSIQADNAANQVASIEPVETDDNISLINQLTEKLNQINLKVDQLFELRKQVSLSPSAADDASVELTDDVVNIDTQSIEFDASTKSSSRIINLARQSFWNGNAEQAEKFYLDLSKFEDADPDVYGELGNVYYAQGKWKQAGEAYYEAAVRLLDLKHKDQAGYLLRVIQGLDEESANKLRQKMSG